MSLSAHTIDIPTRAYPGALGNYVRPFTSQDVDRLEAAMLDLEQADCPVTHHFGPGIYVREVELPTGACVIGHAHNHAHLNIMLEGRITLIKETGEQVTLNAPQTFVGTPGRKIAYVHEKVRWQNVYATPETDLEVLESTLFNKSAAFQTAELDRQDYMRAITSNGFTHDAVTLISENEADQVPFPSGSYKVTTGPSAIHGKGLFATAKIIAGEVIAPARLDGKRTPAGRYTNHSATPNAEMVRDEAGDIHLCALAPIAGCKGGMPGEEITVDYRQALSVR